MARIDRRNVMIGFAARLPELRSAVDGRDTVDELSRRFGVSLDENDVALLRTVTEEEVAAFRRVLEQQFEGVYQFGI